MTLATLSELKDGLNVIYLSDFNSEFYKTQQEFVSKTTISSTFGSYWHNLQDDILPEWREFFQQIKDLKDRKTLDEAIIWLNIENGVPKYLTHKLKPEKKYNWLEVSNTFELNYNKTDTDKDGYWAWGQIVAESGEYLCMDCGYIETFSAGQVFPVCEVCLAGDPEGPLEVTAGFWEKI